MKIFFLHLSDLHLRRDTDPILNRTKQIVAALGCVDAIADACIVSATGDVTFSGTKNEFDLADRFFSSLQTELTDRYGPHNVRFLLVPGNHDCDFSQDVQPREGILDDLYGKLNEMGLDNAIFRSLLAAQAEFFRFASKWMNTATHDPWVFCENSLPFDGVNVHVRSYNTAYGSQLVEQQGKLVFPLHLVPSSCATVDPHSFTIALLHHPYHWLESSNGIALRNHLDTVADLVLTGHQHAESSYSKKSMAGEEVAYFEGAALQGADSADSGFDVVVYDLKEQQLRRFQFRWNGEVYALTQSDAWAAAPRKRARVQFEVDPDYRTFLTDPGTGFTHPRKTKLTLEDIFVYPDISKLSLGKNIAGRDTPEVVKSGDVIDFLLSHDKLFLSAGDRTGKTSLAKILFVELLKAGFIPVNICGADLKTVNERNLISQTYHTFSQQYSRESVDAFRQLEVSRKVLILDSWHLTNLNPQGKALVIEVLARLFGRFYIFSGEGFRIEEIGRRTEIANVLGGFQFCELREFGHVLRGRLIEKWHSVGRDYTWDANSHAHEVHETEKLLSTLLGKNLIPSYPENILSILQALEARQSASTPSGSYGYLYEALLTAALAKVSRDSSELDLMYTFISRLAFYLFNTGRRLLSRADIERVSQEYFDEYSISLGVADYVARLETAQVLINVNGNFGFRYKYVYYYFVARHFQEALRDTATSTETRQKLYVMADQVYYEEYSKILLFLLYLTKDSELIHHVIDNADSIYKTQEPCDFDQHVDFINRLYKEPPKVLIPSSDFERNREEYRKKLDEAREADNFREVETEKLAYSEELHESVKLNIAFKTLELLGQVLRNFPGSLHKNIKVKIARSCYSLGLRVTSAVLKIAENNLEEFRLYVAEIIKEHRPSLSDGELAKTTDEAVIWLTRRAAFGIIKRVSYAVGLELLQETYRAVLEASKGQVSIRLIDLSVKLDHFSGFPEGDIEELWTSLRKNDFSRTIIRDMVAQYIYLFGLDHKTLQKVGSKLDIKVSDARFLDPRTKKLKK